MNTRTQLFLSVIGALLLTKRGLGQKGAFEQILDVNLGKGWFAAIYFQLHFSQFVICSYALCIKK